jgi:hypothetical protein
VKEKPFVPVPPKELTVYDEQHPRPADTADSATLRKTMTAESDRQLDDLFKNNPAEYRDAVGTALRAMINDDLPGPGDVVVSRSSGPALKNGLVMQTGALSRRDAGEAVPFVVLQASDWNGKAVVWVDPSGKASLFDESSKPAEPIERLLRGGFAVISADLFMTGEFSPHKETAAVHRSAEYEKQQYAGFYYGYNRGVLANQVHDLLTELAFVRGWSKLQQIDLVAFGSSGPASLLARGIAGKAIDTSDIDLGGFDFDQVKESFDPMMLPGALKYGGIYGVVPLCSADSGHTHLAGARRQGHYDRAASAANVQLQSEPLDASFVIDELIGPKRSGERVK